MTSILLPELAHCVQDRPEAPARSPVARRNPLRASDLLRTYQEWHFPGDEWRDRHRHHRRNGDRRLKCCRRDVALQGWRPFVTMKHGGTLMFRRATKGLRHRPGGTVTRLGSLDELQ